MTNSLREVARELRHNPNLADNIRDNLSSVSGKKLLRKNRRNLQSNAMIAAITRMHGKSVNFGAILKIDI